MPSVAIPRRNEYRLALGMPQQVKDDLDAFAPNLVHLSTPDLLGVAALKHARRMGLPVVASVRTVFETYLRYYGLGWLEPALRRHLRGFYNRCDQIFVAPTACMIASLRKGGITRDIRQWGGASTSTCFRHTAATVPCARRSVLPNRMWWSPLSDAS